MNAWEKENGKCEVYKLERHVYAVVAAIVLYAMNLHIVPVFGPNALAASPRIGHIHVRADDASWVWADAGGLPIILQGLLPGPHKVLIELVDANHHTLDKGMVTFVIPKKSHLKSISEARAALDPLATHSLM